MILKNLNNQIKYLSNNFIPRFFKMKLISFFDLDINKLRSNVGIRAEDYFKACKKELTVNRKDNRNKYYLHKAFNKHLVRSNLIDNKWWSDFVILAGLTDGSKFRK